MQSKQMRIGFWYLGHCSTSQHPYGPEVQTHLLTGLSLACSGSGAFLGTQRSQPVSQALPSNKLKGRKLHPIPGFGTEKE